MARCTLRASSLSLMMLGDVLFYLLVIVIFIKQDSEEYWLTRIKTIKRNSELTLNKTTASVVVYGNENWVITDWNCFLWRINSELKSHCCCVQMPVEGDDGSRIHKFLTDLEDESESVDWRSPCRDKHISRKESIWVLAIHWDQISCLVMRFTVWLTSRYYMTDFCCTL